MHHARAATLLLMVALAVTACGDDGGDRPDPGATGAGGPTGTAGSGDGSAGGLSTEEYCTVVAREDIRPLNEQYTLALQEIDEAYGAGDEAAFHQAQEQLRLDGQALVQGFRDAAADLVDPEFRSALERVADGLEMFIEDVAQVPIDDADQAPASASEFQEAVVDANAFCEGGQ